MKTTITAIALTAATATTAFAQTPNNYIATDDNGVISERYGNDANTIITRDMATQNELDKTNGTVNLLTQEVRGRDEATNDRIDNLDSEIYRVDQEDHRVVDATVNSDGYLVLHSEDMDGGTKRDKVTGVNIAAGTNGTNGTNGADGADGNDGGKGDKGDDGKDGKDGKDGRDAVTPLGSLSFAAASSSFYGDGIGFGLSDSNYGGLEGSFVLGKNLGGGWRTVVGLTTDFNKRHAASVGVGFSF